MDRVPFAGMTLDKAVARFRLRLDLYSPSPYSTHEFGTSCPRRRASTPGDCCNATQLRRDSCVGPRLRGDDECAARGEAAVFDIRWIRDNPDAFDAGLRKRGIEPGGDVKFAAELIALDEARREVITRAAGGAGAAQRGVQGDRQGQGAKDEAKARAADGRGGRAQGRAGQGRGRAEAADKALHEALSVIPNLPRDEVPEGKDEHGNKEVRRVGEPPKLGWHQQAAAAFRDRRGARADGLRDGGQAVGRAVRGAEGAAGAAGAGAGRVHARYAHGAGEGRSAATRRSRRR